MWCGDHQFNLVLDAVLDVVDKKRYSFRSVLGGVIGFVRSHANLIHAVRYPATYSKVRWGSIYQSCLWVCKARDGLINFASENDKLGAVPPPSGGFVLAPSRR